MAEQEQQVKKNMHPRNKHRFGYDFKALSITVPELADHIEMNKYGNESIDFAAPQAVKWLNKALLKHFYGIDYWEIPSGYLCPPIPGRADYIHYLADLLSSGNNGLIPKGKSIKGLDIGTGANCIYPLIGNSEYGWSFSASETDEIAAESALKIVEANKLNNTIDIRVQTSATDIFKNIIKEDEKFDFTLCNPPFHASAIEAMAGTSRKWRNLGYKEKKKQLLNFGGQHNELWTKGGEEAFVSTMINQSLQFKSQCFWFTTLISKHSTLPRVYKELKYADALEVKTFDMAQGQKISRFVAWTFLSKPEQKSWIKTRW
ncbi:MAG: 23S rRNA (adenine(1618)-N(6))-methyltransferase RlmF [Bacteroidetes bacterium]|nr:23S rRNA (adenine(1618)-N(6))-methyltransferase RlmF [Bacteroidota bacterium]